MLRTTLRLQPQLKKLAQKKALEKNLTLQEIFNQALAEYLRKDFKEKARKLIVKTHNLGVPLDDLKRGDYYE